MVVPKRIRPGRTAAFFALVLSLSPGATLPAEIRTLISTDYAVGPIDIGHGDDGSYALAWAASGGETGVWMQRFDHNGASSGPLLDVGGAGSPFVDRVCISRDAAGNDLVVWRNYTEYGHVSHQLLVTAFDRFGVRILPITELARTDRPFELITALDCTTAAGGWIVAWADAATPDLLSHLFTQWIPVADGPVLPAVELVSGPGLWFPQVQVAASASSVLAAWTWFDLVTDRQGPLTCRLLDGQGFPAAPPRFLLLEGGPRGTLSGFTLDGDGFGRYLLTFAHHRLESATEEVEALALEGDIPSAPPFPVTTRAWVGSSEARPQTAVDSSGRAMLAWRDPWGDNGERTSVRRGFLFGGLPLTDRVSLPVLPFQPPSQPVVSVSPGGRWVVAWPRRPLADSDFGIDAELGSFQDGCEASATALCLAGNRFRATATFHDHLGRDGVGQAVALTPESGTFWFFTAANVELIVKVVDACGHPDFRDFWVYASGLTDVEVTLTVVDTWSGETWERSTDLGEPFPPILDSQAFHTCDAVPIAGRTDAAR